MTSALLEPSATFAGLAEFHAPGSPEMARAMQHVPRFLGASYQLTGMARPADGGELGAVVRQARKLGLSILRLYSASPVGARLSGDGPALLLDLSRMNRILAVDPVNGTALVEPGVTYAQMARHLEQAGLPLLIDSERDPAASVAGSILAKGTGRTPYGDHLLVQCGGEFVLPDGSLLRTGMGAMEGNRAWQLYKYALGPFSDGLAVGSDLMIPSKLGFWLMGQVPAFQPFVADVEDDAALARVVETIRPLKIGNALPGTIAISHRDLDRRRGGTVRKALWRIHGALYGMPRVVEMTMQAVTAALAPDATFLSPDAIARDSLVQEEIALMAGRAGTGTIRLAKRGEVATLNFVAPIEGEAVVAMNGIATAALAKLGLPATCELQVIGRSALLACHMPLDPAREPALAKLEGAAKDLVATMNAAGFNLVAQSPHFDRLAHDLLAATLPGKLLANIEQRLGSRNNRNAKPKS